VYTAAYSREVLDTLKEGKGGEALHSYVCDPMLHPLP